MSIYKKIIFVILPVILVPMVVITTLIFTDAKSALKSEIELNLSSVANLKAKIIEDFFFERRADIIVTANRVDIKESLATMSALSHRQNDPIFLKAKESLDPQVNTLLSEYKYHDIILLDSAGRLIYSYPKNMQNEPLLKLKELPFEGLKNRPFTTEIFKTVSEGRPDYNIFITTPVYDLHNNFAGVLVFGINMNVIYDILNDNSGMGKSGESLIVKKISEKELVFISSLSYDPAATLSKRSLLGGRVALPAQLVVDGKNGVGLSTDYRGVGVLAAWRFMPSLGWGLVCKMDSKEAFLPISKLARIVFAIFFVILLFAIGGAFAIARSISLPIRKLHRGTDAIATGNLDFKLGSEEDSEIGRLSRSFDTMTDKLKHITASRSDLNREIAERRKIERYLKEALMAKSAFTSMVSHELRTPLAALKESISIIADGIPGNINDKQRRLLDLANGNINRLARLINEVLDFQALESGKIPFYMDENNINDVAREVQETMAPVAEKKGLRLDLKLDESIPNIMFDRDKITQVITNLVNNSLKFTDKGGITIMTAVVNDGIKVTVKDTGMGIKEEDMPRLFTQYEQLERKVGSSGLGLAICLDIMRIHEGKIWAESHFGEGSSFHFIIPIKKKVRPEYDKNDTSN